jgi:hypothetical protein
MKLETQEITLVTYGVCKGFEEVYFSCEDEVFGELMILLNTEKEILYYFSEEGTMEEQEKMKDAAVKMIKNGSYRLQSLFMKKEKVEYLQEFSYVLKREELRRMRIYFQRFEREDEGYEYRLTEDVNGERAITYCFPEFDINVENCIVSDEHFIKRLREMGFDPYDIEDENSKLPF